MTIRSNNPETLNFDDTQKIFNNYFKEEITYQTNEVNAVIGYFLKRGFERIAAINTAAIFLQQAQIDKVPAFVLLDTLKGLDDVQLTSVVSQILNLYRTKTSALGFKTSSEINLFDERNIVY